jgi:hypothetical protein
MSPMLRAMRRPEPPRPDSAAALTGTAACAAAGGQCELILPRMVGHAIVAVCRNEIPEGCGSGAVCCLDMLCAADATAPIIQASDYDQSCAVDSDCAEVYVGDACSCELSCGAISAAINKGALAQYTADVAKFRMPCQCPPTPPPCTVETYPGPGPFCVGGVCQIVLCPK